MLSKKQIINQLYEIGVDEEFVIKETSVYLTSIEKWLKDNLKLSNIESNAKQPPNNFQIQDVCDIEESIWSPKYGIKGKLDLTLRTDIRQESFKSLTSSSKVKDNNKSALSQMQSHVIPVELKSGRTTFSAEHEGQVMFYVLLNSEKSPENKMSDFGLLLYLKGKQQQQIKTNRFLIIILLNFRFTNEICKNKSYVSSRFNSTEKRFGLLHVIGKASARAQKRRSHVF